MIAAVELAYAKECGKRDPRTAMHEDVERTNNAMRVAWPVLLAEFRRLDGKKK